MTQALTVWLLQTGEPLPSDPGNPRPMRAMNLAGALVAAGHRVVLWSSAFYHQEKRHRVVAFTRINVNPGLEVRLIASPGYGRNIGPGRLWDHVVLAHNLARELQRETIMPDVAFVGYPPIETAAVMTRWLARRGVPCMLDVKDQWPTIFTDALPAKVRGLGRIALAPYFHYAHRSMRDATALTAMAGDFLRWAAAFAGREVGPLDRVVPLTVPSGQIPDAEIAHAALWWDQQGVRDDGRFRVFFVGSHSQAFDIEPVHGAAQSLIASMPSCEFVLCGDGDQSAAWRARLAGLANVRFPGWVERAQIEALARRSSVALAPYRSSSDFVISVPNKVIDAMALGLPILSPLEGEVARLIAEHKTGLAYGQPGGHTLAQCIHALAGDPQLRESLADNAQRHYHAHFAFDTVYGGLVADLESLARRARPA